MSPLLPTHQWWLQTGTGLRLLRTALRQGRPLKLRLQQQSQLPRM
jgi:hypothetical protein